MTKPKWMTSSEESAEGKRTRRRRGRSARVLAVMRLGSRAVLIAAALSASSAQAEALLPWEVTTTEIEAGRLRALAVRISRQNLLHQLGLGDVRKSDLVDTATQIDRVLESLQAGDPSHSVLPPWTPALRKQIDQVDQTWGQLRRIAVAYAYDQARVRQQFVPREDRRGDPLLLDYFDDLSLQLVTESEVLLALYHEECMERGITQVCPTARDSGYATMLIERAAKEAVCIVADIDSDQNRDRLKATVEAYQELRRANNQSPFFAAALDPARGSSATAAAELLASLRGDWDQMQAELTMLFAGDAQNFDVRRLLETQSRMVTKVERMAGALVRYASSTYGS